MRIVIDGTTPVVGAGVTWLREIVREVDALDAEDEVVFLVKPEEAALGMLSKRSRIEIVRLPVRGRLLWRLLWQQLVLPWRLWRVRASVLVSPYGMTALAAPCPVVLGIQNASPFFGPPATAPLARVRLRLLRRATALSVRRARRIFFVSESSRREISGELELPLDRSTVVPIGVSSLFQPAPLGSSGPGPGGGHVLAVGGISSYKDFLTLIEAWGRLVPRIAASISLVIAGPVLEPLYREALIARVRSLKLEGRIVFTGAVPPEEILALYQRASVLVMASLVETFGIPMIEAMACRIPVIASDIPVAREVCGDAALYYRTGNVDDLTGQLGRILEEAGLRESLVARGAVRSKEFSWKKSVNLLLALAREAVLPQ